MEIQYIKNRAWCFEIGKKCNFKNSHDFLKMLKSTLLKNFIKISILEPFWGKCINDSTKNYRFFGENDFFLPFFANFRAALLCIVRRYLLVVVLNLPTHQIIPTYDDTLQLFCQENVSASTPLNKPRNTIEKSFIKKEISSLNMMGGERKINIFFCCVNFFSKVNPNTVLLVY